MKEKFMSKAASKTLIGAFVIGAIALAVIAVIIFGSGKILTKKPVYIMFFEGSVKGLNEGSQVNFRGVKIGSVKDIELKFDAKDLAFLIPVYVEIDPTKVTGFKGTIGREEAWEELIQKGLRAQLELQSILTGQLMINVDFFPGKPARYIGMDKRYPEIPTVPSPLDELLKTAQELPLKELFDKLLKSIEGIEKVANSPQIGSSLESLSEGLKESRKILTKIDHEIGPMMTNLKETSDSIKAFTDKSQGVPAALEKTLATAQSSLKQAEKTFVSVQKLASDNSVLVYQLDSAMDEVAKASRSVRSLSDYIYRHPESLIKGKRAVKGE
jgi:paraquat-inducible protein B